MKAEIVNEITPKLKVGDFVKDTTSVGSIGIVININARENNGFPKAKRTFGILLFAPNSVAYYDCEKRLSEFRILPKGTKIEITI